jgi:hypothetical protein
MKKFMFLGFIAATMLSLASCDLIEEAKDAINDIQDDQAPAYAESNGGLTITVSQKKSGFGSIHEATFKVDSLKTDTICETAKTTLTFFSDILADEFIKNIKNDSTLVASWSIEKDKNNAKAVNIDQTRAMAGFRKPMVVPVYKGIKKAYDEGGQIVEIMKKFGELEQK